MPKALNVVKLPTPKEQIAADKHRSHLFFDAEDDIRQLAVLTAMASHLHWKELEDGRPISPAGTPLDEMLRTIEGLALDLWQRFYGSERVAV